MDDQERAIRGQDLSSTKIPDIIGKVIGFRCFAEDGTSPATGGCWVSGMNIAECRYGSGHIAPSLDCGCGLYAFNDPDNLMPHYGPIIAIVRSWGKMCIASTGFRSQYSEIIGFSTFQSTRESLQQSKALQERAFHYGVPLIPFNELRSWASTQGQLLPKHTPIENPTPAPIKGTRNPLGIMTPSPLGLPGIPGNMGSESATGIGIIGPPPTFTGGGIPGTISTRIHPGQVIPSAPKVGEALGRPVVPRAFQQRHSSGHLGFWGAMIGICFFILAVISLLNGEILIGVAEAIWASGVVFATQ